MGVFNALRLRKARALMFYLAADSGSQHRTEKIIDLFWQDGPFEKAQMSCRQVVRHIRVALAEKPGIVLQTNGGLICLQIAPDSDTDSSRSRHSADRILFLMRIAEGLQGISASFDSWLAIVTDHMKSSVRSLLDSALAQAGDVENAGNAARIALEVEPANEVAIRFLMRQDWASGRATRAIERYNTLYRYLDDEFDQEPEPETIALLAAIKLDPGGSAAHFAKPDVTPNVTLSVSLTVVPGMDRDQASMAAVLFADLRMRLARFREWRIISAGGQEAGRVALLVQPRVVQGELQLHVDVARVQDGQLLWAEVITAPVANWESKVRLLVTRIAAALSVVVAERSLTDAGSAVYDRWLRSQALLDAWSPQTEGQAVAMLRDIARDAPRFGPAHAELAGALNARQVLLPGTRQTAEIQQLALHHAIEAVSIDPLDTRAHRVLAWCYSYRSEFELAEFHFDQALALNRSNPLTLASCALGFAFTGALDRAADLVAETKAHAAVMEPFHLIYLAAVDYLCGNFAATIDQCNRGAGLMTTVSGWHSAALWQVGEREAAVQRMAGWFDEMRTQWQGDMPPTPDAILDWFTAIFPLRNEPVRVALRATLDAVAEQLLVKAASD